jgi:hypothetical protein
VENLRPVCRDCLNVRLRLDYRSFNGHAVVIQPALGPPVYVFQPADQWAQPFSGTQIADDVRSLLEHMSDECSDCGGRARFLWVESQGLTERNFGETLERAFSALC